jgi:hypothetical protein
MMTFDARRKEMLTQFNDNLTGIAAEQIVWDGVANKSIDKNSPWISVSIQPTTANIASINIPTRRVRHQGLFVVQIFIKPGSTTQQADDLVNSIGDAIEGVRTSSGISFGATEIVRIGVLDAYYQLNTFTSYKYDDLRSV